MIWLAASAEVAANELCASRALLEDRGGGVGADRGQRALDIDRQRLDVAGGIRRGGDQRALGLAGADGDRLGGGVAGDRQRALHVGGQ